MKTITKTIQIYSFAELSQEAKDNAVREFAENNDHPFLNETLDQDLEVLLEKHGITATNEPKVLYSLNSCQGDGAMFEGSFEWKGYTVTITQSGRYYHSNSKITIIMDENANHASDEIDAEFDGIYQEICKELEKIGYMEIEFENSEQAFSDHADANELEFLENGEIY